MTESRKAEFYRAPGADSAICIRDVVLRARDALKQPSSHESIDEIYGIDFAAYRCVFPQRLIVVDQHLVRLHRQYLACDGGLPRGALRDLTERAARHVEEITRDWPSGNRSRSCKQGALE